MQINKMSEKRKKNIWERVHIEGRVPEDMFSDSSVLLSQISRICKFRKMNHYFWHLLT